MSEHEHQFGVPQFRHLHACKVPGCSEWRIGDKDGRWRELTSGEQVSLVAKMMTDISIMQAMQIIHGPVDGAKRARSALGYDK